MLAEQYMPPTRFLHARQRPPRRVAWGKHRPMARRCCAAQRDSQCPAAMFGAPALQQVGASEAHFCQCSIGRNGVLSRTCTGCSAASRHGWVWPVQQSLLASGLLAYFLRRRREAAHFC